MEIILNDDVVGLGDIGEVVNVKPGYARNYLIPRGLAFEAASKRANLAAHRRKQVDAKKKRLQSAAQGLAEKVSGLSVELELKVGLGGKVFGSIGSKDIASKLNEVLAAELGEDAIQLDRRRVILAEPIKAIGNHKVRVKLHPEVQSEIEVIVKGIEAKESEIDAHAHALRTTLEEVTADDDELLLEEDVVAGEETQE